MHDHHTHGSSTTVIEDREGPTTALVAFFIVVIVGVLIWLFAFSGIVFDRDGGTPPAPTQIEDNDTTVNDGDTGTTSDGTTDTQPAPS